MNTHPQRETAAGEAMDGKTTFLVRRNGAFTLVELLVSTTIIALILIMLVQVTNYLSTAWRTTTEKVEKFQEARDAFEAMTRRIAQATLNTYWDYYDYSGTLRSQYINPANFIPFGYGRQSDLRFISGPMHYQPMGSSATCTWALDNGMATQPVDASNMPTHGIFFYAPLGISTSADKPIYGAMDNLLNCFGYFVEFCADTDPNVGTRPTFLVPGSPGAPPIRWRGRLFEMREPTENVDAYNLANTLPGANSSRDWFLRSLAVARGSRPTRVMAENIIALIIQPRLSAVDEASRGTNLWSMLAPEYTYDSTILPTGATNTGNGGQPPSLTNAPKNPGAFITSTTNAADASGIDPRNQLPPLITVTMVALDERSGQRLIDLTNPGASQQTSYSAGLTDPTLGNLYGANPSNSGYALFTKAIQNPTSAYPTGQSILGDAETPGTDLYVFTQRLVQNHLNYRIFSSNVTIRGAKWSRAQAN